MPFVQPSFLKSIFETPLQQRRNGRLYRQMIQKLHPSLTRYPLVKDGITYPFSFPTISSWGWRKMKSAVRLRFVDPSVHDFLGHLSEFIRDTVGNQEVRSHPLYDYPAVLRLIDGYYSGRKELAAEVDWWLTFELWRQSL